MFDRRRLAVSGAVLAALSFLGSALIAWTSYQRDVNQSTTQSQWMPNYWDYFRGGFGLSTSFLFALGIVMVAVAYSMRTTDDPDALFRPEH